jgi:antitoxin ParD1/3/4
MDHFAQPIRPNSSKRSSRRAVSPVATFHCAVAARHIHFDKDCQIRNAPNIVRQTSQPVMSTMNVSLPEEMKRWVEQQTRSGRFGNSSDYVRDLIRRDQERQARIAHLQQLINEGLESGTSDKTMADIRKAARNKLST